MYADRCLVALGVSWPSMTSNSGDKNEPSDSKRLVPISKVESLGPQYRLVLESVVGELGKDYHRFVFDGTVVINYRGVASSQILVTISPSSDVKVAWFMVDIGSGDHVDQLIALSHSLSGTRWNDSCHYGATLDGHPQHSIRDMLLRVVSELEGIEYAKLEEEIKIIHDFKIFEFRGVHPGLDGAEGFVSSSSNSLELYGLLTGDEGWRDVPISRAANVIESRWSSREFVQVMAYGRCVVMLNTKSALYKKRAKDFFSTYFAGDSGYFQAEYDLAGLDHGVLFSCESVLHRFVEADRIVSDIAEAQHRRSKSPKKKSFPESRLFLRELATGKLQSARLRMRDYLARVRDSEVVEVDDMLSLIVDRSGLRRAEEAVGELAESMDQDIDRVGSFGLARLAVLGALVGIVLAVANVILLIGHI